MTLSGMSNLTIDDLLEKGYWQKNKCDLSMKEKSGVPIGVPKYNETLYVRFIQAWILKV